MSVDLKGINHTSLWIKKCGILWETLLKKILKRGIELF